MHIALHLNLTTREKARTFQLFRSDEEEAIELKVISENVDKWEIARDRIVLKKSIGHGAFGVVWRARLSHPDGKLANQTVAAKCFTRKTQLIFSASLLDRPTLGHLGDF